MDKNKINRQDFNKMSASPDQLFVKNKKVKINKSENNIDVPTELYYVYKGSLLLAELSCYNKSKFICNSISLNKNIPNLNYNELFRDIGFGINYDRKEFSNLKECLEYICFNFNQILNSIYFDTPIFNK